MGIETEQFRVIGVDKDTGEDVAVVIDAATRAAAEVKADQQNIDTTHIVRLKPDGETMLQEHTDYAFDAAEARTTTPTDKLIQEIVEHEPLPPTPGPITTTPTTPEIVTTISRPGYTTPTHQYTGTRPTGLSALVFIIVVLAGISAGGYYVLVHQPNLASADDHLMSGEDLFDHPFAEQPAVQADTQPSGQPNVFSRQHGSSSANTYPQNTQRQAQQPASSQEPSALVLQSIIVGQEGRFAVINGQLYKEGSELAGCKLIRVDDNSVLMERQGAQFVLDIPQAPRR